MNPHAVWSHACAVLLVLGAWSALPAQVTSETKARTDVLALRASLTASIIDGSEKPAETLDKLRNHPALIGRSPDPDVGFALAAIDLGQRLVPTGKFAEAKEFFSAAEIALDAALQKEPEVSAKDRAMILQKRALIRGRYLNIIAEAKADLDQAIRLQPEDKSLQRARAVLANSNAEYFKDEVEQTTRK